MNDESESIITGVDAYKTTFRTILAAASATSPVTPNVVALMQALTTADSYITDICARLARGDSLEDAVRVAAAGGIRID